MDRDRREEILAQILHNLHILHNLLGLWLLELVTVFAGGLPGEHIVAGAQFVGLRLSRIVKYKSPPRVAEPTCVKT